MNTIYDFSSELMKFLNQQIEKIKEESIKAAILDIEQKLRKEIGAFTISLIDKEMNIMRNGTDLHIIIKNTFDNNNNINISKV